MLWTECERMRECNGSIASIKEDETFLPPKDSWLPSVIWSFNALIGKIESTKSSMWITILKLGKPPLFLGHPCLTRAPLSRFIASFMNWSTTELLWCQTWKIWSTKASLTNREGWEAIVGDNQIEAARKWNASTSAWQTHPNQILGEASQGRWTQESQVIGFRV